MTPCATTTTFPVLPHAHEEENPHSCHVCAGLGKPNETSSTGKRGDEQHSVVATLRRGHKGVQAGYEYPLYWEQSCKARPASARLSNFTEENHRGSRSDPKTGEAVGDLGPPLGGGFLGARSHIRAVLGFIRSTRGASKAPTPLGVLRRL